jgi:hypothetical protein
MDLTKGPHTEEAKVYQHPYISRRIAGERIADWLRAADASRRARTDPQPAPARHRRRARRAYAAGPLPGQQVGSGTPAGRLGADQGNGAVRYPAELAASGAPGKQGTAGSGDDHSGAAALSQTRC